MLLRMKQASEWKKRKYKKKKISKALPHLENSNTVLFCFFKGIFDIMELPEKTSRYFIKTPQLAKALFTMSIQVLLQSRNIVSPWSWKLANR